MANWIVARETPIGDVIGVCVNDNGGLTVGSVTGEVLEIPGSYIVIAKEEIDTFMEVLTKALAHDDLRSEGE